MSDTYEKVKNYDRITDFYRGKSVLITGAAGFVGSTLVETLLRCCVDIKSIYIVLREKKGVAVETRKEAVFSKNIFNTLKKQNPDALKKVQLVAGDVAQPDLGIKEEDLLKICENVSIVFHCAASVSFLRPLRFLLANNFIGTNNVIELCRKLKNLDALIYTSTQYSNCNRRDTVIEEKIYRLPYPAQRFLDAMKKEGDAELDMLFSQCKPSWPNYYTFSKCLAENLLQDNASDIKSAIIRPAIIATVWKEPLAGYVEENSSLAQLAIGCGKGFVKVIYGSPDAYMDLIPVDVVANAHIVSAWRLATERSPSPLIINCTSRGILDCPLNKFHAHLYGVLQKDPMPKSFKYSSGVYIVNNFPLYVILTAYEHYIPAFAIDFILKISGKKPRLVRLYRFYDKASLTAHYFTSNNWIYETKNLKSLDELHPEDRKMFYTDLTGYTIEKIGEALPSGAPLMDWSTDKKSKEQRMRVVKQRYYFATFMQYSVLFSIFYLLYTIFTVSLI